MDIDFDRVDETVLALLYLTLHDGNRAWKGLDHGTMDRLHQRGLIGRPDGRAKSVALSDDGLRRAEAAFRQLFARRD